MQAARQHAHRGCPSTTHLLHLPRGCCAPPGPMEMAAVTRKVTRLLFVRKVYFGFYEEVKLLFLNLTD